MLSIEVSICFRGISCRRKPRSFLSQSSPLDDHAVKPNFLSIQLGAVLTRMLQHFALRARVICACMPCYPRACPDQYTADGTNLCLAPSGFEVVRACGGLRGGCGGVDPSRIKYEPFSSIYSLDLCRICTHQPLLMLFSREKKGKVSPP